MGLRIKGEALPSIEEIAEQIKTKKPLDEKAAEQSKEDVDIPTTVVDTAPTEVRPDHLPGTDPVDVSGETPKDPVVVPPVEKPKDPQAAKFAALARREKAAREQAAEYERQKSALDARAKEIEEYESRVKGARRPSEILKAHGLTYQQVTEDMLGVFKEPEKDPLDSKFEERLSPYEKRFEEMQAKIKEMEDYAAGLERERVQSMQRQIDNAISKTATERNCDYLVAAGEEGVQLTRNFIQEYYNLNKKVLSYDEACDKIEAYYTDRLTKFAQTKKGLSAFAPTSSVPTAQKPQVEAKERPTTLTNSLSQGTRATTDIDKLSKAEALEVLSRKLKYI